MLREEVVDNRGTVTGAEEIEGQFERNSTKDLNGTLSSLKGVPWCIIASNIFQNSTRLRFTSTRTLLVRRDKNADIVLARGGQDGREVHTLASTPFKS